MKDPLAILSDEERGLLRDRPVPSWTEPMLATLTDERFSDPRWIYERKFDGVRCLAFKDGAELRLLSRNKKSLNAEFPEIADALAKQPRERFVVDGELVAFDGPRTSFQRIQQRLGRDRRDAARPIHPAVYYYVFDVLHVDGRDTTHLPLRTRKEVLRRTLDFDNRVRFSRHRNEDGEHEYEEACRKHWEGILAKRADAPYAHSRSKDWLKFKCGARQEFVVGGFTDPEGSREGFGALLLGYHEGGGLRYAGRVGTGFDDDTLRSMHARLAQAEVDDPPFADPPRGDGLHWTRPSVIVEVGFTEWTDAGRLRHPRYLGERTDKRVENVVRERPA